MALLIYYLLAALFAANGYPSTAFALLYVALIIATGATTAAIWLALINSATTRQRWFSIAFTGAVCAIAATIGLAVLTNSTPADVAMTIATAARIASHGTGAALLLALIAGATRLTNERRRKSAYAPRDVQLLFTAYAGLCALITILPTAHADTAFFNGLVVTGLYTALFLCRPTTARCKQPATDPNPAGSH